MAVEGAPGLLLAIEQSGAGAAIRQSTWIYAAANVGHILALMVFAAAVIVLDLRLLGAFSSSPPEQILIPARRFAALGLILMATTGAVLFIAEASHVAANPVFRIKAVLIALGVLNAMLVGRALAAQLDIWPAGEPLPARIRVGAVLSLLLWFSVAACGRLIAYL